MGENERKRGQDSKANWKILSGLFLLVILIQVVLWILIVSHFASWEDRGTFGDMFGAVNTLFSGLAFAGVIYAIFLQAEQLKMQSQELALQRQELRETKEELKRSASAQENSEKALADQVRVAAAAARLQSLHEDLRQLKKDEKDKKDYYDVFPSGHGVKKKIEKEIGDIEKKINDTRLEVVLLYDFLKNTQLRGRVDYDGDGTPNYLDSDSDNDGIGDNSDSNPFGR